MPPLPPTGESRRQPIRISSRHLLRDALDAARGAPGIVLGVYGPPLVLLAAGAAFSAYDLGRVILRRADALPIRGLVFALSAFASYYVCAIVYSAWARCFVRPVHRPSRAPASTEVPAGKARAPAPRLAIAAPERAAAGPPLDPWRPASATAADPQPWTGEFQFRNIGLVLAGGGAKGLYQAAAMKAIHEFLAERGAVDRVVSIASSSIGSWNALFWLTGLMEPGTGIGGRSLHEEWWTRVQPRHLVRPACDTVPFVGGHLLSHAPWEREFAALFGRSDAPGHGGLQRVLGRDALPHFYMTRTNVNLARLAFETNSHAVAESGGIDTHDLDQARLATSVDRMREAVFTSMGIPPLFPYTLVRNAETSTWAEDGGVIDNLPIRLATAFDAIDLLFVLPLNSSFFLPDRPGAIVPRLYRVVDVRGGLQERAALKSIYLFNQRFVLGGERNPVPAFVITPGQPLQIGTVAFWRIPRVGAEVFDQMYRATRQALDDFFQPDNLWRFFAAYEEIKRPGGRLPAAGYVRMINVDPAWEDGNQFEFETRF
jgi:predicted acylesterase/phospholipase RssA